MSEKAYTIGRIERRPGPATVWAIAFHPISGESPNSPESVDKDAIACVLIKLDRTDDTYTPGVFFPLASKCALLTLIESESHQSGDHVWVVDDLQVAHREILARSSGLLREQSIRWCSLHESPRAVCWDCEGDSVLWVEAANYAPSHALTPSLTPSPILETVERFAGAYGQWVIECFARAASAAAMAMRVAALCHQNGLGSIPVGPGALGSTFVRTREKVQRVRCHHRAWESRLERACLYPGRLECLRLGRHSAPIYRADVNSLYPAMAARVRTPYRFCESGPLTCDDVIAADQRGEVCAAYVTVGSPDIDWPVRVRGRTVWARGRYTTALCGDELLRAINTGCVLKMHLGARYAARMYLGEPVELLHGLRCSLRARGDLIGAEVIKGMLVGLIGRYAQRRHTWARAERRRPALRYGHWRDWHRSDTIPTWVRRISGVTETLISEGDCRHSLPIVTAVIQAAARVFMADCIATVGLGNVLYVDTDCLHLTETGMRALERSQLIDSELMGRFKLVDSGPSAHYWGVRDYRIGDHRVKSGWIGAHHPEHWPAERWEDYILACQSAPLGAAGEIDLDRVPPPTTTRSYQGRVRPDGTIAPIEIYEDCGAAESP